MKIQLRGVSVSFGDRRVLQDLDWALEPGQMCALVGPNGAGKSTLLKAACGIVIPNQGSVTLAQRPLLEIPVRERAQQIAVVHQHTQTVFDYTCLDFVLMGSHARNARFSLDSPKDVEQAKRLLASLDAGSLAQQPFSALSGGEAQRVVLARTMMTEAPIWLLDEPTANLDPKHQISTLNAVRRHVQASAAHAALVVLHDLNLARRFFDRVTVLDQGVVAADGTPKNVLTSELLSDVYDVEIQSVSYEGGDVFVVNSDP